jgi:stage III sporulation protein AD
MTITKIAVFALVSVLLLSLLKKYVSQISLLTEIAVVVIIIIAVLPEFKTLLNAFSDIGNMTSVSGDILKTMLKAFSILTVGGIVSDVCRDNGENAVAGVLDTVVKILACVSAMPTFTAVLVTALGLLER